MTDPRISIVIPFLNMGRFLPEAVESVLAQSFTDWELLIVDDDSQAEELAVARALADRQPHRIRVLESHGASTGSSATRNRGIREARGEYLALLDADDIWHPFKLSHQVGLLDAAPEAAMTFARVRYFFEGESEAREFDQPFSPLRAGLYLPPAVLPLFLRHMEVYPCPSVTLIRMKAFREVGGFEEHFRKIRTDLAAWTKLIVRFPVVADDTVVGRYRQHPGSSVAESNRLGKTFAYDKSYYDWALRYIERADPGVRRKLEPILCEKMLYHTVLDSHAKGIRSALGWRIYVGFRLIRYFAFWREFRLFRALVLKAKSFGG